MNHAMQQAVMAAALVLEQRLHSAYNKDKLSTELTYFI